MNILVPLEGTTSEELIWPFCRAMPCEGARTIDLVHVVAEGAEPESVNRAKARLAQAASAFRGLGSVEAHVRRGDPAREIVALADELAVDMVLMHVRPRAERDRRRGPSVTERVLDQSHRPVVAIHEDQRSPHSRLYARVALGGRVMHRTMEQR